MWVAAHLIYYILQRGWTVDRKTHKEEIGLGIGQGPQAIVFLLAGSIPESQFDRLA